MQRIIFLTVLLLIIVSTVQAGSPDETPAIKETAMNYMNAWYQGDAEKMQGSLHEKLAKRSLREAYDGKKKLRLTNAASMISYTKSGYGRNLWRNDFDIEVIVLDSYGDIATVKVIAPHYLEYLHLVKTGKEWVIVNALYEKKSPANE